MTYQNMERKRNPTTSRADKEQQEKGKPLLAVAVKRAKITDLFRQSDAHGDEEIREEERGESERRESVSLFAKC